MDRFPFLPACLWAWKAKSWNFSHIIDVLNAVPAPPLQFSTSWWGQTFKNIKYVPPLSCSHLFSLNHHHNVARFRQLGPPRWQLSMAVWQPCLKRTDKAQICPDTYRLFGLLLPGSRFVHTEGLSTVWDHRFVLFFTTFSQPHYPTCSTYLRVLTNMCSCSYACGTSLFTLALQLVPLKCWLDTWLQTAGMLSLWGNISKEKQRPTSALCNTLGLSLQSNLHKKYRRWMMRLLMSG